MSRMSDYCKAYHVKRFREYSHWSEREVAGLHTELLDEADGAADRSNDGDGGSSLSAARPLSDDDVLFLHDNYRVTDGVFVDEHVVFDEVTPEWRTFCDSVLGFEVPDYARVVPAERGTSEGERDEASATIESNTTTIATGA